MSSSDARDARAILGLRCGFVVLMPDHLGRTDIADVRNPEETLLVEADHLLTGVRRMCVRRHYLAGEDAAGLTTCPVMSPYPGRGEKICGADLYPGYMLGDLDGDPLETIRRLIGALRMVTAQRDQAVSVARDHIRRGHVSR